MNKQVPNYRMFTSAGNSAVDAILTAARREKTSFDNVMLGLQILSGHPDFAEAWDTAVREAVLTAYEFNQNLEKATPSLMAGEDLPSEVFQFFFDFYCNNGEMPYGVAKARTGDPHDWIVAQISDHIQMVP